MSFKSSALISAAAIACAFGMSAANAATSPGVNFNVVITINPKCTISSPAIADINLSSHDTTDTNVSNSTSFKVLCTKKTAYSVSMKPSNNDTGGAGVLKGQTSGNTDTINYQLRQTSATGAAWGSVIGTNTVTGTPNTDGTTEGNFTVFASVATIGNVLPDTYKDTVTVTVNY